jgi:predicted solute-binding protein
MRLLIDETFVSGPYTAPIAAGWVAPPAGIDVVVKERLAAGDVGADDVALAPSSELLRLQRTHAVVTGVAVVADGSGAVAMRTPVRPDAIAATPVRLLDVSGTAELLARATLKPFYGIDATSWVREANASEAARAEVVIVEGAEALREPEAGFGEDLCRAWFILTDQSVVSHVLLAPRNLPPDRRHDVIAFLAAVRDVAHERRREWRPQLAARFGVGPDRASGLWTAQRLSLESRDQRSLLDLLARGAQGTTYPAPADVRFIDGASSV